MRNESRNEIKRQQLQEVNDHLNKELEILKTHQSELLEMKHKMKLN